MQHCVAIFQVYTRSKDANLASLHFHIWLYKLYKHIICRTTLCFKSCYVFQYKKKNL